MKDRVYSNGMEIAYCNTYHMLAGLFTKALYGALFMNYHEVIMEWTDIYTLHMGPP